MKKPYSIVVVAEGIEHPAHLSASAYVAERIQTLTGIETRDTRLGYVQRGGSPSAMDRILATRYGAYAVELITRGNYGQMVAVRDGKIGSVSLEKVGGKLSLVDPHDPLIDKARKLGVFFGDEWIQ